MGILDSYIEARKQEYEGLKKSVSDLLNAGYLTEKELNKAIGKAYQIGHHIGHCRRVRGSDVSEQIARNRDDD